jgi:predicted transglutaminase-like cysteine proteinase
MFSGVGRHGLAGFAVFLVIAFGGSAPACAQWQSYPAAIAPGQWTKPALPEIEPFGFHTVPVTGGPLLIKWIGAIADIRAESSILARCRDDMQSCPPAARKFLEVIAEGHAHEGRARIGVINRAINLAIQPMSDLAQWGVPDRWSAPLATLTTGRGDCEDYAIAKYVALGEAGVPADHLRLVIVRELGAAEDHAVVAVRLDNSWIVLDNRRLALVEDVDLRRVLPRFVLDYSGVKQFAPPIMADAEAAGPPATDRPLERDIIASQAKQSGVAAADFRTTSSLRITRSDQ